MAPARRRPTLASKGMERRRLVRRGGLALIVLLCALGGAWVAPRITGPAVHATSVADVQLQLRVSPPSQRGVSLYVPLADWGLRAAVFDAPVQVRAEPRRINRVGVVRVVSTGGRDA